MTYYIHKLIFGFKMWKGFMRGVREFGEKGNVLTTVVDFYSTNTNTNVVESGPQQETGQSAGQDKGSPNGNDQRQQSNKCQINLHKILEAVGLSTALCLGTFASYPHCWRKHKHSLACDVDKSKKKSTCKLLQLILGTAVAQPLTNKPEDDTETKEQESEAQTEAETEIEDEPDELDAVEEAKKNLQRIAGHVDNIFGVLCVRNGRHYEAFRSFEYAAQMGDVKACFNLGLCYEQGIGTPMDHARAVKYYKKASKLGHPGAKYNLAVCYIQGLGGLPVDHEKASDLFFSAARSGLEEAVYVLEYEAEQEKTDAQQAGPSTRGNWRPRETKQEDVPDIWAPQLHLAETTSSGDWNCNSLQRHSV